MYIIKNKLNYGTVHLYVLDNVWNMSYLKSTWLHQRMFHFNVRSDIIENKKDVHWHMSKWKGVALSRLMPVNFVNFFFTKMNEW